MWPQLEFYLLHYPILVGLPDYCALITIAVASWFTFYCGDRRTGFELLIASWLMLCFGIVYGFVHTLIFISSPLTVPPVRYVIRDLHDVLIGTVVPFLLTIPVAAHLLTDDEHRSRKLHRLLLAGGIAGVLDAVFLFLLLLWCLG